MGYGPRLMEVIYCFTRGCFKHRLSKLAELLQIEREWYIEVMNAWAVGGNHGERMGGA